ncbi:MAG: chorismate synthase, partial [Candidatus Omnitrophica bacterium]|nr:chorismate synthase [Candidatus Omnitrophota bacterium]
ALLVENKDQSLDRLPVVTRPRPGHADLAGALKYNQHDVRNILERASARETTARVAVGAVCRRFLEECGIRILSHVVGIGDVKCEVGALEFEELSRRISGSPVSCADKAVSDKMVQAIDAAKAGKDTLGGVFEVVAYGVPPGLGSHVQWDRKLDAQLVHALVSIQAIKAAEIGAGVSAAAERGSAVHDEIFYSAQRGFYRKTNRCGGIEGGMSTGEPIVVRGYMKPISTLLKPLASVDIQSKEAFEATVERSDVCAVPAAGVIAEAAVSFVLAAAFLEKFGGDSLEEVRRNQNAYVEQVKKF